MYDEDRQTALSMYAELFDKASDEEALLTFLNSPTRQAVVLARAYNARERDLAVRGQSGKGDADVESGSVPGFVKLINNVTEKAKENGILSSYVSAWSDTPVTGSGALSDAADTAAEQDSPASVEPDPDPNTPADTDRRRRQVRNADHMTGIRTDPSEEKVSAPETSSPSDQNTESVSSDKEKSVHDPDLPSDQAPVEGPVDSSDFADETGSRSMSAYDRYLRTAKKSSGGAPATVRSAPTPQKDDNRELSVPLLILFILIAVPVTALLLILLLIPTVVALSLSLILTVFGVQVAASAFSGFAVFADIMVVLGSALVLTAFGLLFFWLFIWLIGNVMVNLINSVIVLGEKTVMSGGDEE